MQRVKRKVFLRSPSFLRKKYFNNERDYCREVPRSLKFQNIFARWRLSAARLPAAASRRAQKALFRLVPAGGPRAIADKRASESWNAHFSRRARALHAICFSEIIFQSKIFNESRFLFPKRVCKFWRASRKIEIKKKISKKTVREKFLIKPFLESLKFVPIILKNKFFIKFHFIYFSMFFKRFLVFFDFYNPS